MNANNDCYLKLDNDSLISSHQLKEVVVRSSRIVCKADKFIFNVSHNENKFGDELLNQAPGVYVADKDVSINGTGGTRVFVDDREVKMSGEQLICYLHTLSSNDILRIEVQNMSDATNDASAKGGIIYIVLRHRSLDGYLGSLSLSPNFSKRFISTSSSASIDCHSKKWSTFGSIIFMPSFRDKGIISSTRDYHTVSNTFYSLGDLNQPHYNLVSRLGLFYSIDSLRTIGTTFEYYYDDVDLQTNDHSSFLRSSILWNSDGKYRQKMVYNMYAATLSYKQRLDEKGSLFKVLLDYTQKKSRNNDYYHIIQYWNGNDTIYRSLFVSTYRVLSSDFSLKKVFQNKSQMQLGTKLTMTGMHCHTDYWGWFHNNWYPLSSYIYKLNYREYIGALYGSYSASWGRWNITTGLRLEYTRTSNRTDHLDKKYFDWFPNLTVGYSLDEINKWMISLQYARNIERPTFDALNPNRIQLSEYSYQIGNPNLRPTYIHRLCATLIYNYRFTLSIGGNLHTDLIREFCKQDADNADVSYIQYENHHHENHWFIHLSAPFQPTAWSNLSVNLTGVRQCIQMIGNTDYSNHYLLFVNSTASFFMPSNYSAELQYNSNSRLYSGNSEIAPHQTLNASISKKWSNLGLIATMGVNNIFNECYRFRMNLEAYSTNSESNLASNGRIFKFAIAWNFNRGKHFKRQQVENTSERNRF